QKAGGTGLNLTGANTVILHDLWWNPAVEDQAAGRAHRFGQKNVVQVILFITEGTIEEKIYELQQKKRELINQVIQPGETMLSSLSEDDIKELLSLYQFISKCPDDRSGLRFGCKNDNNFPYRGVLIGNG